MLRDIALIRSHNGNCSPSFQFFMYIWSVFKHAGGGRKKNLIMCGHDTRISDVCTLKLRPSPKTTTFLILKNTIGRNILATRMQS